MYKLNLNGNVINYYHIRLLIHKIINMNSQESSMTTEQELIRNYVEQCPVQLGVDYIDNKLTFSWDLRNVEAPTGVFSRHVLVIDAENFAQDDQIMDIIEAYYKYLKLGDFMKVIYLKHTYKSSWIEKTQTKININPPSNPEKCSTKTMLNSAFKQAKKFSEPVVVSLVSACITKKILSEWMEIKKRHQFKYVLNLFCCDADDLKTMQTWYQAVELFIFCNVGSFEHQARLCAYELLKIRMLDSQLSIHCYNGDIDLRNFTGNHWQLEQQSLVRRHFALKNSHDYVERLQINIDSKFLLCLEVNFKFTLLDDTKFLMTKAFAFNAVNTNESTETILPESGNSSRNPFRAFNHSEMNKNRYLLPKRRIEKIIIRSKGNTWDC